uniref:uncharacterized protein LOC118519057 isoform X3 n=1 Tax=Halichoerus grypus TaxID=9711 RepID=UPI001658CEEA|nr:uncharacterized protein LOC118519057 isoform X3 [Halichoerus grypus]
MSQDSVGLSNSREMGSSGPSCAVLGTQFWELQTQEVKGGVGGGDRQTAPLVPSGLAPFSRMDFVFFQFWSLLHKEPPNRSLRTFCSSDGPSLGPSMSMQYEKFQHLESEKQSQRSRNGVSGRVTEDLCWSRRGQRPGRPLPPSVLGQPPTSITCASPPPGQVPGALLPQSPALTPSSLTGLPPPLSFLHQLCSGPRPLLFSLGLSLLLLVGICVIGSQNSKFRRDLATLRATFSNFTANTVAEVQALKSQGGHLQEVITSLKAEVENHKQGLQAARSLNDKVFSLESKLEQEQKELKAGHSDALLRVQQLARDLRSLTCQMAALKSNGSQNTCCPPNWLEYGGSCYWFSGSGKTWEDADRLLCRAISAHTPGWASVTLKESGNGWTGRTMRPTSSECALAFCALLRPCTLAPPGSGPQPLVPGPPGCPLSVPAGCGPLPAGTGSQASRTTGTGTGWAGARTARTSTPTASGTTMPARGPTAGCARPAWARPASAAAGASHRTAQPPAGGEREGAFP